MEKYFKVYSVQNIPRIKNGEADSLAKAADHLPSGVLYELAMLPSVIKEKAFTSHRMGRLEGTHHRMFVGNLLAKLI